MLIRWPDPRLERPAVEVVDFTDLNLLTDQMFACMAEHRGVGLAACQIGDPRRVLVGSPHLVMVNPLIKARQGSQRAREGCLSFPGEYIETLRSAVVWVAYRRLDGSAASLRADGMLAVCLQHEIDHLDGIVFHHRVAS